ncbi:hypothetical protein C3L33_16002, partial [Rhododendron williamsianum]
MELEKQLKLLNKPAVKTIEVYILLEGARELLEREDMELEKQLKLLNKPAVKTIEYAVARTRPGPNKFNGAGARLSLHNPRVSGRQYSASRFLLRNGNDAIQAGWRVDPTLYGDTRTRRFIRLDAGQSHCFNTRCPGFVQVRSDKLLDLVYPQVSKRGVLEYEAPLFIDRDLVNGNWWLLVGESNTEVGFWPKRIFSGLADLASYAEWGGEVFYPPGTPIPEMGSGFPVVRDTKYDAYLRKVEVVNAAGQNIDAYNTETFEDTRIYGVVDLEHTKLGHLVLYGGGGRQ